MELLIGCWVRAYVLVMFAVLMRISLTVARTVSDDATASQCQSRYTRSLDPSLTRGIWTEEQDTQLRRAVEVFGHSWSDVCTFVTGRSSEQCRDRWQDFLNPTISRTKWTESEDLALLSAIEHVGQGKWKEVSRAMDNGRTDSMVSQQWHKCSHYLTNSCHSAEADIWLS